MGKLGRAILLASENFRELHSNQFLEWMELRTSFFHSHFQKVLYYIANDSGYIQIPKYIFKSQTNLAIYLKLNNMDKNYWGEAKE